MVSCPICGHRMARRRLNAHKMKWHPGITLPRRMQDFLREQAETVRRILKRRRARHK